MSLLTELAHAKVNLYLHVLGRRADGYHELATEVVFPELADRLTFEPSDLLTLSVTGPFAESCGPRADNLVLRAARRLQEETGARAGAAIHLDKRLPAGAGLGGGSADAAATLRGLNRLWGLGLDRSRLAQIGLSLGADVPMCIYSEPLFAAGVGERLELHPEQTLFWLVLVHPGVGVATPEVFARLTEEERTRRVGQPARPEFVSIDETANDLQRAAISVSPLVGQVLLTMQTMLPEPRMVRMTGSGSACFALFATEDDAQRYAVTLRRDHPQWWVEATASAPRP